MVLVKKHKDQGRIILTVCDKDLIGKKFEDKKKKLDLTSDFYDGNEMDEDKLKEISEKSYIIHFIGKKSIRFALKYGFVDEENIRVIKTIPHAQMIRL